MALSSSGASSGGSELAEMEVLQQENALLQAQLENLLASRRQLLLLKERVKSGALPEKADDATPAKKAPTKRGPRATKAAAVDGEAKPTTTRRRTAKKTGSEADSTVASKAAAVVQTVAA